MTENELLKIIGAGGLSLREITHREGLCCSCDREKVNDIRELAYLLVQRGLLAITTEGRYRLVKK